MRRSKRHRIDVVVVGDGPRADAVAQRLLDAEVPVTCVPHDAVSRILWNAEGAIVEHAGGVVLGSFLIMAVPAESIELFDWEPVLPIARSGPIGVVHWACTDDDAALAGDAVLERR